jgi:hypothetical protein
MVKRTVEDDEPERPPSPSVHKRSAEDDGEVVLFEQKCKLFFTESKACQQTACCRLER